MKTIEKIKNSIRAYVIGDALGVPFEFQNPTKFNCVGFSKGGYHNQPIGTWSDDTSILLCLIDALSIKTNNMMDVFNKMRDNLKDWYHNKGFNAGEGLFDIGSQTSSSIMRNGCPRTDSMGNGAMFYALPVAIYRSTKKEFVASETMSLFNFFSLFTHNNPNCFKFGGNYCCLLEKLLRALPQENIKFDFSVDSYQNRGDVINTYNLILDNYLKLRTKSSTLKEDLCNVVNLGFDTDTNAALFGALMGIHKEVDIEDWKQVRKYREIDKLIDNFVNSLTMEHIKDV